MMKHTILLGALLAAGCAAADFAEKVLFDFEKPLAEGRLTVDSGRVERKSGRLVISAAAGETVRFRLKPAAGEWDLKPYVNLSLKVANHGEAEAMFRLMIKDALTTDESWYKPNLVHQGWVAPGETRDFPALLVRHKFKNQNSRPDYLDRFPRMHGLPHAQMLVWFGVDVTRISELVFQLEPSDAPQRITIDDVRGSRRASPELMETDPDAFFPFIDRYGQYMHEDWPGKVRSDGDLLADKKRELEDLAKHPAPKSLNRFGGWADGPSLEPTGSFRVEKVDGKWWFVDPEGKLFWSFGCNAVGLQMSRVKLGDKEHFYDWIPAKDDPEFGKYHYPQREMFDSRSYVYHRKFGADYEPAYHELSLRRIKSWGLNTLGGWSPSAKNQPEEWKTPYCVNLFIGSRKIEAIEKLADPFAPGFEQAVLRSINANAFSKNDPYCIGYFDNNEVHWGKNPADVMRKVLEESPDDQPMKKALLKFLRDEEPTDDSLAAFYDVMVDTYHRKCRDAIRSAAPNRLYLGNRVYEGGMLNAVMKAQAKYCDVVSFNIYEKDVARFNIRDPKQLPFFEADKPFMVTEFNFGAVDRGKFFTGIGYAADQRNRGENLANYIRSGLDNPRCVGAHWYTYCDSPTGSRTIIAENANCGFVSSSDTPYHELISASRAIGASMYGRRSKDR